MARVYRIGEAAKILNVKTSVLRFWESEFPQIRAIILKKTCISCKKSIPCSIRKA